MVTPSDKAREAAGLDPASSSGRQLSPLDARINKVRAMQEQYALALPRGMEAQQLVRDGITALRTVPDLAKCTEPSILGALMTAAQLGLRPNVPALGHGWVLPYWNGKENRYDAQWILGYQGMIELAQRSGLVADITAHTIYANEYRLIRYGLDERLEHEPRFDDDRGEAEVWYAICRFTNGGRAWLALGRQDIERIRLRSPGGKSTKGPWATDYDMMALKSVLRRLFKYLPKSTALALAFASDGSVRTDLSADALEQMDDRAVEDKPADKTRNDDDTVDAEVVEDKPADLDAVADAQLDAAYEQAMDEQSGGGSQTGQKRRR